tara:strand:+ start:173 stop:400 length:228 start_codon:yes stop_codon:yes gene_type:complete
LLEINKDIPTIKKNSTPFQFLIRLPVDITGQNKIIKLMKLILEEGKLKFLKIFKKIDATNIRKNNNPITPVSTNH